MPDSTLSTLEQIIVKVRRLTRSPSDAQLSAATIKEYINTFVLYDFPEVLRLFSLKTTLEFFTCPYIDKYLSSDVPEHPLYNLNNKYITFHPPVYIAGTEGRLHQTRELFYSLYPLTNSKLNIATGDGLVVNYADTLTSHPVLRGNVLFNSIDANNNGLSVYDDGEGNLTGDCVAGGTINYVSGAYDFTFTVAPADGEYIYSQIVAYSEGKPTDVLFFQNAFYIRPVPDGVYRVQIEAFTRPTELLDNDQSPELAEWWQYISYGAAKKVFEDRMDHQSVAMIMPELKNQETLILRRTIMQQSDQRVKTIYSP